MAKTILSQEEALFLLHLLDSTNFHFPLLTLHYLERTYLLFTINRIHREMKIYFSEYKAVLREEGEEMGKGLEETECKKIPDMSVNV